MGRLYMLAGGIVDSGGPHDAVSAYVAVSAGRESRLFKVEGPVAAPRITELPAATTVDLGLFREELERDLQPSLQRAHAVQGVAAISSPSSAWVCKLVRDHLLAVEGVDPGA